MKYSTFFLPLGTSLCAYQIMACVIFTCYGINGVVWHRSKYGHRYSHQWNSREGDGWCYLLNTSMLPCFVTLESHCCVDELKYVRWWGVEPCIRHNLGTETHGMVTFVGKPLECNYTAYSSTQSAAEKPPTDQQWAGPDCQKPCRRQIS